MILPQLKKQLAALGAQAVESTKRESSFKRQRFMRQVMIINPELISAYVSEHLSDPSYRSDTNKSSVQIRIGEMNLSGRLRTHIKQEIIDDPLNRTTFSIITKILDGYFHDFVLSNTGKNDNASNIAEHLQFENRNDTLISELLPQMMALRNSISKNPDATKMSLALKAAIEHNVFGLGITCPFGRKISSIFAIQPIRISATKVIIRPDKQGGGLPTFIHRELKGQAQIKTPHLLLAAH